MAEIPRTAAAWFDRGIREYRAGRQDTARHCFEQAIARDAKHAAAHHALGLMVLQGGDPAGALPYLQRAADLDPDNSGHLANLGVALRQAGKHVEARAAYDRALALQPDSATAHNNRGNACRELGDNRAALADYDRALALDPGYAEAHYNRGVLLQKLGRSADAFAALTRATEFNPAYFDAWNSRGNVLRDLGRWDDAGDDYRRALQVAAQSGRSDSDTVADVHYNLAAVLRDQGDVAGAAAALHTALARRPGFVQARWSLAFSGLTPCHDSVAEMDETRRAFPAALAALDAEVRRIPDRLADWEPAIGVSQPFYFAYQQENVRAALATGGQLCADVMAAWRTREQITLPRPAPRGKRRLRIGFVSSQVHRHSVWDVITRGWLTQLDRSQFDVLCYHVGWRRDRETRVAKEASARFLIGPKTFPQWVELIGRDRPDVLIYPEIGMDPTTARLAALRLAPVQCVAWGHPVTSGLPTLDYYLGAALLEPDDADAHYSETLVRLPNLGCWFEPLGAASDAVAGNGNQAGAGSAPAAGAAALRSPTRPVADTPRFICCQQVAKYHPAHDVVFTRIARELGRCRFTFVELGRTHGAWEKFRARLGRAFAGAGLNRDDWCEFLPTLPRAEFLALLRTQDLYLDTLAFSGFTTAIQAMTCDGLPVVTVDGPFLRSRLAAGLLRHIDVADTVAADVDGYVALAVDLARDPLRRDAIRDRIGANLGRAYRDDAVIRALEAFLLRTSG